VLSADDSVLSMWSQPKKRAPFQLHANHKSDVLMRLQVESQLASRKVQSYMTSKSVLVQLPEQLMHAVSTGNHAKIEEWLDRGGEVDAAYEPPDQTVRSVTMLMVASSLGDAHLVALLLRHGADVNRQNGSGGTALMFATFVGHAAVVRQLCHAGADLSLRKSDGRTALRVARHMRHRECEYALYDEMARTLRFNQPRGSVPTPQYASEAAPVRVGTGSGLGVDTGSGLAAWHRFARIVRLHSICGSSSEKVAITTNAMVREVRVAHMASGSDVLNRWRHASRSRRRAAQSAPLPEPMLTAVKTNNAPAIAIWLDGSGYIDALWDAPDGSARGGTMLMVACSQGYMELVELLLARGANIDHQDANGVTALMCAVCYSHEAIVRLLLRIGASADLHDVNGCTAVEWALEASGGGTSACVRAFLEVQRPRTLAAWR